MKSRILVLSAVALALVLVGWPTAALAQRTSGGAQTTGTAVGGGGGASGGGSSSSGSSGGGSGSAATSSSGGASMGSSSSPSAPTHFPGEVGVRRASGSGFGGPVGRTMATGPIGVPEQSRARGGHPSQGQAMARQAPPTLNNYPNYNGTYYPPNTWSGAYYTGYSYYPYSSWDPWGYSWGYPYGLGLYGLGMGYFYYDPLYYPFWGYGFGAGGYADSGAAKSEGSIKLKVKPAEAQVFVDGAFVGRVDDFNGAFQHLDLEPGAHRVEIKADGYQPLTFEVRVLPGRTITYEGELKK